MRRLEFPWLEQFFGDVCFGARALWKNPGFFIVAVLTLALGIGANTAIFSLVEGVVLTALPYPRPDRLVMVLESRPSVKQLDISYPDFQDWQHGVHSFEQMAALTWRNYDLTAPGTSEHLDGMEVSSGFFGTLGVKLGLGREFSPSEDRPNAAQALIIGDRLWKDRFAPGFDRPHVITFEGGLSPSLTRTASSTRTAYRQLLDRIREIPSVQEADFTNVVPLSEQDNGGPFWVGAQQSTSMQDAPHAL